MRENILSVLDKIDSCLQKSFTNTISLPSLASGYPGIALFYSYYSQFTQDTHYQNLSSSIIENCFEYIAQNDATYTFADGIAGLGWTIQHLLKNNLLEGTEDALDEIDDYLKQVSIYQIKSGNYDFLHGSMGCGIYFLERANKVSHDALGKLINGLSKTAVRKEEGIFWPDRFINAAQNRQDLIANFGLAHGLPSIAVFLSKVYNKDIKQIQCKELLEQCINFMLSYASYLKTSKNFLPQSILYGAKLNEVDYKGRLAWCYGDLGIAIALYQASISLTRDDWKQIAVNIVINTTHRIHYEDTMIVDGGVCHGMAGVAHIYKRFYYYTENVLFLDSANYWYSRLLKFIENRGIDNFSEWYPPQNKWIESFGLLTGLAGVGISLISAVSDDIEPKWDRCLLLS